MEVANLQQEFKTAFDREPERVFFLPVGST